MRAHTVAKRPNLLIVLVDQMRTMAMGCAGNEQVKTPCLDAFAAQGASMDHAVSAIPVCTPARACLLTGRYPLSHTTLTNNSMLPPDMPSMGKMLKDAGYATGYIGKWHLAGEGYIGETSYNGGHVGYIPPGEMRHGFDYWAVHHCSHKYDRAFYYRDEPEPITIDGWEPDGQTDLAIEFMRRRATADTRTPFSLVLSWGPPHTPFGAPPEFSALYDPAQIRFRGNVEFSERFLRCDNRLPYRDMKEPEAILRHFTAGYWAAISNLDWNFGRILDALDEMGLRDDTVVVFTSDHGEMLGSHGHMHKLQPWDESVRIPFLVRYPGLIPAGLRSNAPFGLPDVLPSLFSLMGIQIPAGVEGCDLSELLLGRDDTGPESAFLVWPCNAVSWGKKWTDLSEGRSALPVGFMRPYRGVRTRTHTYVRDRAGPWLLYDNEHDPLQQNNLVAGGSTHAVPQELETMLQDWLDRTGDTFEDTAFYRDKIDLETGVLHTGT